MRVLLANLWWNPAWRSLADLVHPGRGDRAHAPLARALVRAGHEVVVVQDAPVAETHCDEGVQWVAVPASTTERARRRAAALVRHPWPGSVVVPAAWLGEVDRALAGQGFAEGRPAQVLHGFDAPAYAATEALGALSRARGVPFVATHHGAVPVRGARERAAQRRAWSALDALCFSTVAHAAPFVEAGALREEQVAEVQEISSEFTFAPAASAGPLRCLHLGRLDTVKDPLTTLEGFARLRALVPGATLDLAWTEAPLLGQVRRRTAALGLGDAVRLRGRLDPASVERALQEADLLLQASLREVCGTAVVEALATGCRPVVSDIPSFRALLGRELAGGLFPVGDPAGLAAAALRVRHTPRAVVRARFDAALSWDRVAARLGDVYARVGAR